MQTKEALVENFNYFVEYSIKHAKELRHHSDFGSMAQELENSICAVFDDRFRLIDLLLSEQDKVKQHYENYLEVKGELERVLDGCMKDCDVLDELDMFCKDIKYNPNHKYTVEEIHEKLCQILST